MIAELHGKSTLASENYLPKWLHHLALWPAMNASSCYFYILANTWYCQSLGSHYSDTGVMMGFCIFNLQFPNDRHVEHCFICLSAIYISFVRHLLRSLFISQAAHFLIVKFLRGLYIFCITVIYLTCLCKYLLPICSLSCHSLDVISFMCFETVINSVWHVHFLIVCC